MGYKIVCLTCRKSFSKGRDNLHAPENCQECGSQYISYPHRFRPPGKDDLAAWKVVKYLYENGFVYQHIYKNIEVKRTTTIYRNYAKYPDNLIDARDFVAEYKNQAIIKDLS